MSRRAVVRILAGVAVLTVVLAASAAAGPWHSYAIRCTPSGVGAVKANGARARLIFQNDDQTATILLYGDIHAVTASDNSSQVGMWRLHAATLGAQAGAGAYHVTSRMDLDGPAAQGGFNCVTADGQSGILRWIEFFGR